MYPVDTASAAHLATATVKAVGVDLKKRYVKGLDAIYSGDMWSMPKVPTFRKDDRGSDL